MNKTTTYCLQWHTMKYYITHVNSKNCINCFWLFGYEINLTITHIKAKLNNTSDIVNVVGTN